MPETPIHKEELTSFDADVLKVPAGISLDHINVVILIADSKGHIIYANQAVKNIYLLDPKEVLGDGWWNITSENQEEAVKRKGDVVLFAEGKLDSDQFALFERAFTRNDNVTIWTQWTLTRTADNRVIGIAQDITEKKVLAQQLTLKVKENELLLQEVYHRVKNNLQIILSLLKFEFEHIQDEQTLKALKRRTHAFTPCL